MIPILLQPFLRRFYPPEAFGTFSVYMSVVGILLIVLSLKYENAIILPKKDKSAANLLLLSIIINLFFSFVIFVVVLIWHHQINQLLNIHPAYQQFIYLIPFGAFLYSFYQSLNFWLIRKKAFYAITVNKLTRRGFEGFLQMGFHFIRMKTGLIWGDIIGNIANSIWGVKQCVNTGLNLKTFSFVKLKYVAKHYQEYPKYNVIPSLMSACSYLMPAILINTFYSAENTGYFDLSKLLLSVPLALIASSLSNVLLQRIVERKNLNESIKKDLMAIFSVVAIIGVVEIILIGLWANEIFSVIFGKNWIFSGEISKILVWSYALNFIISSFTGLFISLQRIKIFGIWQFFYFLGILSLFLFKDLIFIDFLKIYVVIEVVCYFALLLILFNIVFKYEVSIK